MSFHAFFGPFSTLTEKTLFWTPPPPLPLLPARLTLTLFLTSLTLASYWLGWGPATSLGLTTGGLLCSS